MQKMMIQTLLLFKTVFANLCLHGKKTAKMYDIVLGLNKMGCKNLKIKKEFSNFVSIAL